MRPGWAGPELPAFPFGQTAPYANQRLWLAQRPRPAQIDYETGLADPLYLPGVTAAPGEPRELWVLLARRVAVPGWSHVPGEFRQFRKAPNPAAVVLMPQAGHCRHVPGCQLSVQSVRVHFQPASPVRASSKKPPTCPRYRSSSCSQDDLAGRARTFVEWVFGVHPPSCCYLYPFLAMSNSPSQEFPGGREPCWRTRLHPPDTRR
jgi:hypothetical protein